MTSGRIGFLMGLLGIGLCGACGSSSSVSSETDADVTTERSPDSGTTLTGAAGATGAAGTTGGTVETSGGTSGTATGGAVALGGETGKRPIESSSGTPITSGTVPMGKTVGASTTSCQQVIVLNNPAQSLTGFQQKAPSGYPNSAEAGDPPRAFLVAGKDAVIVPGPAVTYGAGSLDVSAAQLITCAHYESECSEYNKGYRMKVNERLSFLIIVDDWEEEVALGQVEFCVNNGTLSTQLVFAGIGDGIVHPRITAILDGVSGKPVEAVDIESRSSR